MMRLRRVKVLGRGEDKVLDDYCLAFAVMKVKLDEGKNYYCYCYCYCSCSFWCIVWMGIWESLEEVVVMGVMMKKEEWWARIIRRIGLGHGVQRGNLDYPVKGLIHNGCGTLLLREARRACARFVRVRSTTTSNN